MKKRKLKNFAKRKPSKQATVSSLIKDIYEDTGYSKADIKEVFDSLFRVIKRRAMAGELIKLPGLGFLYPYIRPRSIRHALNGVGLGVEGAEPEMKEIPPKWGLKFTVNGTTKREFEEMEVTKEQEDALYDD